MPLRSFIATPARLALLCMAAYLIVLGVVAENQPWGRGWWHDFKFHLKQKSPSYSVPDENSPEMAALQKKIEAWYPKILERYPILKVEYKNIPDDQNGFLQIIEWLEEISPPTNGVYHNGVLAKLPSDFFEKIDWGNFLANPQEIEPFLKSKREILERAMIIGRLTEQSAAGISPDRYLFKIYLLVNESIKYLRLKAIAEANRGDTEAALETLKAIRGWANHYSNTETPYLLTTTMATAIRLSLQSTIHSEILPLLAQGDINYDQWSELTKSKLNLQNQWLKTLRGEWNVISKSQLSTNFLMSENPNDPIAYLSAYAAAFSTLLDPIIPLDLDNTNIPLPPNGLSRKSQAMYREQVVTPGLTAFRKGWLRAQARLRQYEIAFTLKRLEAEGHNLRSLDQKTLGTLPLQILPDVHLTIDFDKRLITSPLEDTNAKPITF